MPNKLYLRKDPANYSKYVLARIDTKGDPVKISNYSVSGYWEDFVKVAHAVKEKKDLKHEFYCSVIYHAPQTCSCDQLSTDETIQFYNGFKHCSPFDVFEHVPYEEALDFANRFLAVEKLRRQYKSLKEKTILNNFIPEKNRNVTTQQTRSQASKTQRIRSWTSLE